MRALCNREALLTAFGMVSGVVPARSPKPILQNVKLIAEADEGSVLMGTDLEVGIRHRVLGVKVEQPGSVILPTAQTGSILRTSTDIELAIETDDERLVVRGLHSEFTLPVEDANLFPEVPDFAAVSYHVVAACRSEEADPPDDLRHRRREHPLCPGGRSGGVDGRVDRDGRHRRSATGTDVGPGRCRESTRRLQPASPLSRSRPSS